MAERVKPKRGLFSFGSLLYCTEDALSFVPGCMLHVSDVILDMKRFFQGLTGKIGKKSDIDGVLGRVERTDVIFLDDLFLWDYRK